MNIEPRKHHNKVLITGGSGMLGEPLTHHLRSLGWPVISHSRQSNSDISFDLNNFSESFSKIESLKPDFIVNLVGLTNVDECETDPKKANRLNIETIQPIAEYLSKYSDCRLVHISTDQVYDGQGPHKEINTKITNEYARSKLESEKIAYSVGGTILRTNFFGPSKKRPSISDWAINNLKSETRFDVFSDILFSPLIISTLCEMIALVISNHKPGVYNLGSREGMSKADFVLTLAEHLKLNSDKTNPCLSASFPFKAYRPKDMRMDVSYFESTFSTHLPSLMKEINKLKLA